MNKTNINDQLQDILNTLARLRKLLFIALVVAIYAFLLWRITVLKDASPSQSTDASQSSTATNIDQATVNKITQLQNNSVNVQALFNQARQNPFAE